MVASVHRALDRYNPTRVFRSVPVLDSHGFGTKASELQRLLQPIPHALRTGWTDSDQKSGIQTGGVETLSLADALSRVIPNANCRMSRNSPWTRLKAPGPGRFCFLISPAFATGDNNYLR